MIIMGEGGGLRELDDEFQAAVLILGRHES